MKQKSFIILFTLSFAVSGAFAQKFTKPVPTPVLYHQVLNGKTAYPELITGKTEVQYTENGLNITGNNSVVRLDRYYSLGERLIRYHVRFSPDAKAVFQSNTGDFTAYVDVPGKTVSIKSTPVISRRVDFLEHNSEYIVEIHHIYQKAKVRIIDLFSGKSTEIEAVNDGPGGYGAGVLNAGVSAGMQHDYYCFGLQSGTSMLVKQLSVLSRKCGLTLLIYGDSITEPEGYFPENDFPQSWTQLIIGQTGGKAMASGRGGCTVNEVLLRIKNELPYIKAKYVMVTIGTNGGNTEANLSELVEYIIEQGSIPILNNIPANESGTQLEANRLIEKIRNKYSISGCRFDWATSLNHDGTEVDKTTMYHEDYTGSWGQIYHHPNVKGSLLMFTRTLIDIPEIYE
jgi:hypothetical protein